MFLTEKEKGRKWFPEHTVCGSHQMLVRQEVTRTRDGSHSAKVWQFLSKPEGTLTHHMTQELQSWVFISDDLFSSGSWYTNIHRNFTHNIQVSFSGWLVKLNCGPPNHGHSSAAKRNKLSTWAAAEMNQGNSSWKKPTSEDYIPHGFIYVTFMRWHDHRFGLGRGAGREGRVWLPEGSRRSFVVIVTSWLQFFVSLHRAPRPVHSHARIHAWWDLNELCGRTSAAVTAAVPGALWIMVSLGHVPRRESLGHTVVLFLVFLRDLRTVFHSACTNSHSLSSTPSPAFIVCRFLDEGHFDWCEVVLICIALIISDAEHLFYVPLGHLYVFFGEMAIQVFRSLFHWAVSLILSCMSCLYILKINLLSVASRG